MSVGFCKFCRQGIAVDADPDTSEQELNDLATAKCTCDGAIHYAWKNAVLEEFDQNLEVLFRKQPDIVELMKLGGQMIMDGKMKKLTVSQGIGKTIALGMKDKGLCVAITNKQKEETISYG